MRMLRSEEMYTPLPHRTPPPESFCRACASNRYRAKEILKNAEFYERYPYALIAISTGHKPTCPNRTVSDVLVSPVREALRVRGLAHDKFPEKDSDKQKVKKPKPSCPVRLTWYQCLIKKVHPDGSPCTREDDCPGCPPMPRDRNGQPIF